MTATEVRRVPTSSATRAPRGSRATSMAGALDSRPSREAESNQAWMPMAIGGLLKLRRRE
jgi:hypothetical protein